MLNSFFRLNVCPNIEGAENDGWFYSRTAMSSSFKSTVRTSNLCQRLGGKIF